MDSVTLWEVEQVQEQADEIVGRYVITHKYAWRKDALHYRTVSVFNDAPWKRIRTGNLAGLSPEQALARLQARGFVLTGRRL